MDDVSPSRIIDSAIARLGSESHQVLPADAIRFSRGINLIKDVLTEVVSDSSEPTLQARKRGTLQMFDLWRLLRTTTKSFRQRDDFGSRLCVSFVSSPADTPLGPNGERSGHLIVFHAAISVLEILCRHSTEAKNWFRTGLPHNLSDALSPEFYSRLLNEPGDNRVNEPGQTAFRYVDECEALRRAFLISEKAVQAVDGFIPGNEDFSFHSEHCRPLFTADGLTEAIQEISQLPWFSLPAEPGPANAMDRTSARAELAQAIDDLIDCVENATVEVKNANGEGSSIGHGFTLETIQEFLSKDRNVLKLASSLGLDLPSINSLAGGVAADKFPKKPVEYEGHTNLPGDWEDRSCTRDET